jgi:DNA-binding NtrC family response regulator
MKKPVIVLAEQEPTLRRHLLALLRQQHFEVFASSDPSGVFRMLRLRQPVNLLIIAASFRDEQDGLEIVHQLRQSGSLTPVIVLASRSSEALAIAALKIGVSDYWKPPFPDAAFLDSVRCALTRERGIVAPPSHIPSTDMTAGAMEDAIIGCSAPIQTVKTYLSRVAATESSALITGETGTGKELAADFLHRQSRRRLRPFVRVNCAAIPDSLLESELFGHERGAFTGAFESREGALALADGGTVFLDEIGDMSPYAQAKILRAIENKEIQRLGGKGLKPIDIRIVTATNRDLRQLMEEQKFRPDLYYRLNVAHLHLPPLRERKDDLPLLCAHYIREMNRKFGRAVEGFTAEAMAMLTQHEWPGNIRELKNLIEAVFINLPAQPVTLVDLPEQFRRCCQETSALPRDERSQVLAALFATNWNKYQAAQKLHWSRMTLYRKMAKYHIVSSRNPGRG